MQASELVRVVAAQLNEGEDAPMATLTSAVPYFLVRLTAICIERRDLGVLREFILRAMQIGLANVDDVAGFLGMRREDVQLEVDHLVREFFLSAHGTPTIFSLMGKGVRAISEIGLTQSSIREVACYVNGITRRIESSPGDLVPRKRLPAKTVVLPAIPARPPRVDELDIGSVKGAIAGAKNMLPRLLEISRLGRVVRTYSLYLTGHVLLRRGIHGAPLVCVSGGASADISGHIGAHPALQFLKSTIERHESHVKRTISQHKAEMKSAAFAQPALVRAALTSFVLYSDASPEKASDAKDAFIKATSDLVRASHWLNAPEAQALFSRAILRAEDKLVVVAPPLSTTLFDIAALERLADALTRGVKVELHVAADDNRFSDRGSLTSQLIGAQIIPIAAGGDWCGFCCDQSFAVIGATKVVISPMGRCEPFFGAMMTNDKQLEALLFALAGRAGVPVTQKRKRRVALIPQR